MVGQWFVVHDGLIGAARLPSLARPRQRIGIGEVLVLLACGAAAATAVGLVKLGLRIPGHALVLAAFPMALGMSVAPRQLAGTVISAGAFGTALLLGAAGTARYGAGSLVSLCLLGPMIDVALHRARRGWQVYAAFLVAGVATNLVALASRAAPKLLGFDVAGGRPLDAWWLQAVYTYALSGVIAGLLGALCWFHFNERRTQSDAP